MPAAGHQARTCAHPTIIIGNPRGERVSGNRGAALEPLMDGHMEIPERSQEPQQQLTADQLEELRKIRRLQMMMNMVMSVLSQDENLTIEEASELVANTKRAALAMFPDKEFAFDILYKPRLERVMRERFRIQ
jgi:hypothetical protein